MVDDDAEDDVAEDDAKTHRPIGPYTLRLPSISGQELFLSFFVDFLLWIEC